MAKEYGKKGILLLFTSKRYGKEGKKGMGYGVWGRGSGV